MSLSHKLEDLSLVFHAKLGIVAHIWNSNTPKVRGKVETDFLEGHRPVTLVMQ